MIQIFASVIIAFPISLMLVFVCNILHDANRHRDRIAGTLFLIERHLAEDRRRR